MNSKISRCESVNKLIELISELERKFFLNKDDGSISYFNIVKEKMYWIDKSMNQSFKITLDMEIGDLLVWHGGTLKQQILDFAYFIETGKKIDLLTRHWSISKKSQIKLHQLAYDLGIINNSKNFSFYDYSESKDISFKIKEASEGLRPSNVRTR